MDSDTGHRIGKVEWVMTAKKLRASPFEKKKIGTEQIPTLVFTEINQLLRVF